MGDSRLAVKTEEGIALAQDRGVQFRSLNEMADFAIRVVNSGLAPSQFKSSPDAVLVAMQHGMEVGLSPMASLHSIAVINGRPTLYGDGLMAVARAHPDCIDIVETLDRGQGDDNIVAKCEIHRRDCLPLVRTFSVADAKLAGLWKKAGPWTQYPKRMLQMRARSFAIRDAFADALKGIRCAEEEHDTPPREVRGRVVETKLILPGDEPDPELPEPRPGVEQPDTNASSPSITDRSGDDAPQAAALDSSLPDLF